MGHCTIVRQLTAPRPTAQHYRSMRAGESDKRELPHQWIGQLLPDVPDDDVTPPLLINQNIGVRDGY